MDSRPLRPDVGNDSMARKGKQRSRTGCNTCRKRKVKCDERPGGCQNCVRLNLPCPNAPSYHSSMQQQQQQQSGPLGRSHGDLIQTQAGLRRSRTYRSCRTCRMSKTRCSGERPICLRCKNKNFECSYDGKQAPAWVESVAIDLEPRDSPPLFRGESSPAPTPTSVSAERVTQPQQGFSSSRDKSPTIELDADRLKKVPDHLAWLLSPSLPSKENLILLVEQYFVNVHHLRCFGFIHKPSFMQELDDHSNASRRHNILLHVICALGAKFFCMNLIEHDALLGDFPLLVGNQWARKAHSLLFANLNNVSIQNTMAVVLLHEHELRIGNYASAFNLTGLGVRMAQALQINLEYSPTLIHPNRGDIPWSSRETRRRLMWSIYIMDAWVGSGVDELTLVKESDIKIQLPCNERNFTLQIPCIVETLEHGQYLPFLSQETLAAGPIDTLDLQAQFIRLLSIRKKVLRFVKHLDRAQAPWEPNSEFSLLEQALQRWSDGLPNSLLFSRTAIYMRKESSQFAAFFLLHITYHQTLCDLNRVGMKDLFKIRAALKIPPQRSDFLKTVQDKCFEHATAMAMIFEEALRHGNEAFSDTWLSVVAHDSSRVIVHYVVKNLGSAREKKAIVKPHATICLQANIRALKRMIPMYQLAKPLHIAASRMLRKGGFDLADLSDTSTATGGSLDTDMPSTLEPPPQFSPEYVLNPLAIYRMARRDIGEKEKNAPERNQAATANDQPMTSTSIGMERVESSFETMNNVPDGDESAPMNDTPWFPDTGLDNMAADFQLPTSFDHLQAYFPLMLNNFSLPTQGAFEDIEPSGAVSNISGFSDVSTSAFRSSATPLLGIGVGESQAPSYPPIDQGHHHPW